MYEQILSTQQVNGIILMERSLPFMPFNLVCTYCQKPYTVKKTKEFRNSKYCSMQCFYDSRARLVIENGETKKRCAKCDTVKPFSEYHKSSRSQTGARSECKACQKAYMQVYVKANSEHRNNLARKWRGLNHEYYKSLNRKYTRELREEVVNALGGQCTCCGESNFAFLAIDHIQNDGKDHRAKVGTSSGVYRDVRRQGYPKDKFQILCHNCNVAKQIYGECPHKGGDC